MADPAHTQAVGKVTDAGPHVREIEARRDLLRHTLDGVCVWPLFRMTVAMGLVDPTAKPAAAKVPGFGLGAQMAVALRDIVAWWKAPKKVQAAVVTCSTYRTEHEGNRWRDVMFDDLRGAIASEYRIERVNNRALFERNRESLHPSDMTTTWIALGYRARARRPRTDDIRPVAASLVADLEAAGAQGPLNIANVVQRLDVFRYQRRVWAGLLRRVGACAVLFDDGYHQHDLVAAARDAGVHACELQHGVFLEDGAEYSWSAYAAPYRDRMPVPERLFVFGDHWRGLLERDGFWNDRVRVIGNARIDRQRALRGGVSRAASGGACTLLVTTQGLSREALCRFLADTLALAQEWKSLRVVLKLHPVFDPDTEPYRQLSRDERVRIVRGDELPGTMDLLRESDFHASISSACHYDAIGLGVPTIIVALPSHDVVMPLHRAGHAILARSPADMLAALRQPRDSSRDEDVSYRYFRPGAAGNLERELAELCPTRA